MAIHEIHSIKEVISYLDRDTHIFFDLDNTVLMPIQDFGSEHWELSMTEHFILEGVSEKEAQTRASHLWKAVQTVSEIRLVEQETAQFIKDLQKLGYPVLAITARSPEFHEVTHNQLKFLGIQFQENKVEYSFDIPAFYSKGIFFCGDCKKGEVLKSYIQAHSCTKIAMVDDRLSHLEIAADLLPIEFIGLRYGHLDRHRSDYTPDEISKLLFKIFNHPEACKFLRNGLA